VSTLAATIAAVTSLSSVTLSPPALEVDSRDGIAVTHAVLRLNPPPRRNISDGIESDIKRVNFIANVMATEPVLRRVARLQGVSPDQIAAEARSNENVPSALAEPDSERHANQILQAHDPYKVEIQARSTVPTLDIYSQAPSVNAARELADGTISGTNAFLKDLAKRGGADVPAPVTLQQLGPARAALLDPFAPIKIAGLTFLVVFAVSLGLLYGLVQIRLGWVLRRDRDAHLTGTANGHGSAAASRAAHRQDPAERSGGDWPRTGRLLPWLIAAFIAMLWLVPVNAIWLEASLPIDLKLDRLIVPIMVLIWLLSLTAKGPGAPRWRFTRVHAAVAGFVAVAFLSVVLNAVHLNQTLELGVAIKKLVLLGAFFSILLVVSSVLRPTEVRAFLTLNLILATVCALGILWEYRFETNFFYDWSAKALPGVFHATPLVTEYDDIGRRAVIGPADLGLEAVAMLSLALPIGLVRLIESATARERVLYALATCLLLGAMVATFRKSALLAPLSVCVVLAYFRRRALLRMVPLGVVILLAIPILAPQALGTVIDQFKPHRLGVATVSDRVSDYDAIRPDILSHPVLGRGYGSYEHRTYRILDNDLLQRLVETGLVGLAAYVLMLLLVFSSAIPLIRGRDPTRAEAGLVAAAAAVAFLVLSALFDVMSFPHGPYILMVLFGLLAVTVDAEEPQALGASRLPPSRHAAPVLPVSDPGRGRESLPAPVL
jgi:O-antigen ligase